MKVLIAGILMVVGLTIPHVACAQPNYFVYLSCASDDLVYGVPNVGGVTCESGNSQGWTMYDLTNNSSVADGDTVTFETSNFMNWQIITVSGPHSGAPLEVWDSMVDYDTTDEFVIENLDCDSCDIVDGTRVSLQSVSTGEFWTAVSCGGGNVNGTATSRGTCETFEISGDLPQ